MTKKLLTKQLLRNQTCETCVKRIVSSNCRRVALTCEKWCDWEIWNSYLFVVMSREAYQTLDRTFKVESSALIKSIEIFDYDGFKLGVVDRHNFSISPGDMLTIKHA